MESYTVDQLSDEVFGHLCNIAIDKCNDKMEKRRAGCGGRAMRKRVLIKNFVSELMRVQNDRELEPCEMGDESVTYVFEYEEETQPESLLPEDTSLDFEDMSKSELWLSEGDHYSDYLGDSLLSHDGQQTAVATGGETKLPSLGRFDIFGPLEATQEGGKPEAVLPQDGYVPYDGFVAFELSPVSQYELEELTYSPLSDVMDPLPPLQPVRAEPSDKLFLSLNNNCYSEMKTFTPLPGDCLSDELLADPIITDLDAGKENCFRKKRKSSEGPLLSEAMICDQKRPKL